jgi:predicted transcriptional regulator
MRTRETATISLPPAMLREVERARKIEHRTRSELVREAIRTYLAMRRLPVYTPTQAELRRIERGRAEIRAGHFIAYDDLARRLDARPRPARRKNA